jgi:hypothetical protein
LIGFCATLFILSFFTNLKEISIPIALVILIVSIILIINLFIFRQIILLLYNLAIVSFILITGIFFLYGCFDGGRSLDEKLCKLPHPANSIIRWIEFLGGIFLSIFIVYSVYVFTGSTLYFMTWIFVIIIIVLAIISIVFLLTGKFNAWIGTYSFYSAIYFSYLVIAFLFANIIFSQPGFSPMIIRIIIGVIDVLILLYTIGTLIEERAQIISKKLRFLKAETILIWLIFSKASYELAVIIDPFLTSVRNQWVLFIFIALLGIVGIYGILSYKKHRKKSK